MFVKTALPGLPWPPTETTARPDPKNYVQNARLFRQLSDHDQLINDSNPKASFISLRYLTIRAQKYAAFVDHKPQSAALCGKVYAVLYHSGVLC